MSANCQELSKPQICVQWSLCGVGGVHASIELCVPISAVSASKSLHRCTVFEVLSLVLGSDASAVNGVGR